jgi:hypothetical protein
MHAMRRNVKLASIIPIPPVHPSAGSPGKGALWISNPLQVHIATWYRSICGFVQARSRFAKERQE